MGIVALPLLNIGEPQFLKEPSLPLNQGVYVTGFVVTCDVCLCVGSQAQTLRFCSVEMVWHLCRTALNPEKLA